MQYLQRRTRVIALCTAAFAGTLCLAACGGGSGVSPSPIATVAPKSTPTPTPTPTPTLPPTTTNSTTLSSSGTTMNLPAVTGGISASLTVPPVTSGSGATLSATLSLTAPTSAPAPQAVHTMTAASHAGVAYITITSNQSVTLNGGLSVSFVVGPSTQTYFLAGYLPTIGWQYGVAGPATPDSSGKVTFSTPGGSVTIPANTTVILALTNDTPGALSVSPQSLTFLDASNGQALTPAEGNYTASFSATSSNTKVATVGNGDVPGTLWVTPVAAGTATITITDIYGQQVTVPVTVTTTPVTIQ